MDSAGMHRPRNVDWKRAAALLYGDWGTSKAYVIGLAFVAAGYASLPIILAVCALTAIVGYNYVIICKHFPDGGGVYSAARNQSRVLAVVGALLLVANFTVTAAMSGWAAMNYFQVPDRWIPLATMGLIIGVGAMNFFGPKHSGSLAMLLAVPMVVAIVLVVGMSVPYLSLESLKPSKLPFSDKWVAFTGVILALSGVEAIANLTGVMKLDPGSNPDVPLVGRTARRAILPVALEVVLGTCLLGWAMLSLPDDLKPDLELRLEDMLRFLAEEYGAMSFGITFGHIFGWAVGCIVGLLLLSAVNTAVAALIGPLLADARDLRALAGPRVCAIGPGTAARLLRFGITPDTQPVDHRAPGVVAAMANAGSLRGARVLLPVSNGSANSLADALRHAGAELTEVTAYRTITEEGDAHLGLYRQMLDRRIDAVTFTSANTVRAFVEIYGTEQSPDLLSGTVVATIGPGAADAAAAAGIRVDIATEGATVAVLVDGLIRQFRH